MLHQPITAAAPLTSVSSMKTKAEREQLLADVTAALAPYGVEIEITPYSDRHFVAMASAPGIRASFDFDGLDPHPSMIHWHNARDPLQAVRGAWVESDINFSHRKKATSFPSTFQSLIAMLVAGFAAAADGSAFR
jgi:hypothetical protein